MNLAIIEDNPKELELIKKMLTKNFPDIKVLGEAPSVVDGISLLKQTNPDVAIMDVLIQGGTSFDILEKLGHWDLEIIFITSYEKFAIKAFRISAVDYILKPIGEDDFVEAVSRASKKIREIRNADQLRFLVSNYNNLGTPDAKIALPGAKGLVFVRPSEILYCESDNTYTTFYLEGDKHILISKTLKSCEEMLSDFSFARVHNRVLVNLQHVSEYQRGEGGVVILSNGVALNVSRRRKDSFLNSFLKIS